MPPETTGTSAPATGDGDGATPAPGTGSAPASGAPPAKPGSQAAPPATGDEPAGDGLARAIEAERAQRRDAEKQLRDAGFVKQGDKWVNTAQMSEIEKRDARIKELEDQTAGAAAREQERNLRVAAIEAATTLKFRNPSLAWRLLDIADVKFEDDGTPKNVEALLKKIAEAEPYLVSASGSDFGGGNRGKTPGQATPSMDELLRAAARGG
jgi:hypothetical protein